MKEYKSITILWDESSPDILGQRLSSFAEAGWEVAFMFPNTSSRMNDDRTFYRIILVRDKLAPGTVVVQDKH